MVVKPQQHCYAYVSLWALCIAVFDFLMLYHFGSPALCVVLPVTFVLGILLCLYGLVWLRTISFEEKGCCISCLGIHKFIPWDRLAIKQEENFKGILSYPGTFAKNPDAGAVFSVQKKQRPRRLGPEEYCILRNPFSTFFVVYREENSKAKVLSSHVVERESFLSTLTSFGVKLEKDCNR